MLVVWGAITLTFVALSLVKGDVVDAIAGNAQLSPEVRAQIVSDYHLDRSPIEQYGAYLWRLLHLDLGQSYALRMPVSEAIGQQIGPTFQLLLAATVVSFLTAIVVALLTANRPRWVRGPASAVEVVLVAIPSFWLGILLLSVFSFGLHWFPAIGNDGISGLVLPTIALAATPTALLVQVLRQGLERVLDEPFVVTARTRGLGESAVLLRHVLRHALMPVVTLSGWIAGAMISGAVVIEQVFSRQGLGRLIVNAIGAKDFPLITGIVIVAAVFYVVVNLAIDAAYVRLDPRLRKAAA
ncbi:ABC transporter permease [Patulibacter sp. NPDC049589]|uniref:ABC transporter permease n=1 Tax=Patulibacter sp. NPDC049589 TaxID=3154731 RepID=UPI00343C2C04